MKNGMSYYGVPKDPGKGPAGGGQPAGGGAGKGCLGCFGVIVAVVLLFAGCTAVTVANQEPYDANNEYEAIAQCEPRVEGMLKAPSTAEFNSNASTSGSRVWTVTGTVDAENSFGAMVRSSYGCTVTIGDGDANTTVDYFK